MKTHLLLSLATLTLTALVGCSNKPPSCADEKTVDLVKEIFYQSVAEKMNPQVIPLSMLDIMKQNTKVTIDAIRTSNIDEKVGKLTCDASLEIEPPSTWKALTVPDSFRIEMIRNPLISPDLKVKGLKIVSEIRYTSQRTEGKNEQLVELVGYEEMANLMVAMGRIGVYKTTSVTPPPPAIAAAPVTAAPVESPTAPAVYASPAAADAKSQQAPSNDSEIAAARAVPPRTLSKVKLQLLECGDYCHLKFADANGNMLSAICSDAAECRSWAQNPKLFVTMIGATADLVLGKKFIPEGGETMDNVLRIIVSSNN